MPSHTKAARAVIYARYSSDQQRDASIEDQVEVCRRLIEREGWQQTGTYEDRSISGASRFRPGYQTLLKDAEARKFDILVCEALDRLGRNLADVASLHDHLSFFGIRIFAATTGEVTALHIGMLGTMAQMYLSDLREKTRRGQLGRALQGRIPGGRAYGYDVVEPDRSGRRTERGERRINEAEATMVRRIFEAYAAGQSPRAIARRLNAEGVPGPDGRAWCDTTIRGQVARGTGILNNALYVGRLEWNRCAYVKDPRTGRRVARPNPRDEWEVVEVPALRIIDDELWARVKARQQAVRFEIGRDEGGNALNRAHRRRFLLSGILQCGACGGGYTIMGKNRYGCATHRSKGTCTNERTIARHEIEERVLAGLKDRLMAPELVAAFVEEFRREANRAAREAEQRLITHRRELAEVERKIESIVKAIEDGMYSSVLKQRMAALEARKHEIEAALASGPHASPAVRVHPGIARIYRDKVARLQEALNEDEVREEAAELLRGLIDRIVLTQVEKGIKAELYGDLAGILGLCGAAEHGASDDKIKLPGTGVPGSQLSVVAGAGFEPATFRL